MKAKEDSAWYRDWFDTPYYHMLYKHRDENEARFFLTNLIQHLQLPNGSKLLDIPCGKGRHAHILHDLGYDTTGLDLSANNIKMAKAEAEEGLDFARHDMREVHASNSYHAIFNLFTSIGYFDDEADNLKVVQAFAEQLVSGGTLVIDFLNVKKTIQDLIQREERLEDGIRFQIEREVKDGFIEKRIFFEDKGEVHRHKERIRALELADFHSYFNASGLHLVDVFGSYDLKPFHGHDSERLILIAKKP